MRGSHKRKTFGFLDLSFKAGRSKTLGGFGGGFDDRLWDRMDTELDLARLERYQTSPRGCHYAWVKSITTNDGGTAPVGRVVLDVAGSGIRYRTGSRCAILPENPPDLVGRTLDALHARGEEPIQLNSRWREAVRLRHGYGHANVLSLRSLLTFGCIRPVTRPMAKALLAMTHDVGLGRVVEARAEDQSELWELLGALEATVFTPPRLWKARPRQTEA